MNLSQKRLRLKKEQILKSAMKIINKRGYEGATMEEIAAELLMTKGSLYYYFKNKEDLMYQVHNLVLLEAADELKAILKQGTSATEAMREMVRVHINFAVDERETYNLILKPQATYKQEEHLKETLSLRKKYSELFDQVIERGIVSGEFTVREPIAARMFILGSLNWLQQWYDIEGRISKEYLQSLYFEYIINSLQGRVK